MATDWRDERIAALEAEVARKDGELAVRDARIADLEGQVATLTSQVTALTKQVADLMEKLGRNSRNSHLPPSSDPPERRRSKRGADVKDLTSPNLSRACHALTFFLALTGCRQQHGADALPPGPDTAAVCAAAVSRVPDPYERFGDVVPIGAGGGWLVLAKGQSSDATQALAGLGLHAEGVVACSDQGLVIWIHGAIMDEPRARDALSTALSAKSVTVSDLIVFPVKASQDWLARECADPVVCCHQIQVGCRFQAATTDDMQRCVQQAIGELKAKGFAIDSSCG